MKTSRRMKVILLAALLVGFTLERLVSRVLHNVTVFMLLAAVMLGVYVSVGDPDLKLGVIPGMDSEFVMTAAVLMPLYHSTPLHIMGNLLGLMVASMLPILVMRRAQIYWVLAAGVVGPGLAVWLYGSMGVHVGASGLVWAILMAGLVYSIIWLVNLNFAVLLAYPVPFLLMTKALAGLMPGTVGMSWESHLGGAIAGILTGGFLMLHELYRRR